MGDRVCLTCGAPAEDRDDEFIVLYTYCDECGEKRIYGPKAEYKQQT